MKDDRTGLDVASVGDAEGAGALVGLDAPTDPLATVPAEERQRILAAADRAANAQPMIAPSVHRDTIRREVAAWHAAHRPALESDREIAERIDADADRAMGQFTTPETLARAEAEPSKNPGRLPAERLTEEELAEIERLDREATPGPWEQTYAYNNAGMPTADFKIPAHNGGATVEILADDAALIVAYRTAAPRLAAEVRALRGEVAGRIAQLDMANAEIARLTAEIAQKDHTIALLQAERESENEALRRLTAELAARAPERDASRPPPADEDTRPRLTGRDADDIELARAVRDTLREVTHAGAIERLEELLDVEKEAAVRPGLTEEQAQIARAEPIIAAWLAYFAAMDRQHESGSAEDARVVRDLRAKAEAMYRGGPDIVYFVALARHRASQGEAGAMFSPSPVRWKNGKLASRGETGPAAVAINDEERPDEEFGRVWRAQRSAQQARAAAQRPSTLPDLGPAPYRTTMATATTADEELRVTAASLRITVTDLGSVAHDPQKKGAS